MSLPSRSPKAVRESDKVSAAGSPNRPPALFISPECMSARRKVPVVTMTAFARSVSPLPNRMENRPGPPGSGRSADTEPSTIERFASLVRIR